MLSTNVTSLIDFRVRLRDRLNGPDGANHCDTAKDPLLNYLFGDKKIRLSTIDNEDMIV